MTKEVVLRGSLIYKGFKPWFTEDDEGEVILQLGSGTIKVIGYQNQLRGLQEGDYVRCGLRPDNNGYIYLVSINLDADQTRLARIINRNDKKENE